MRNFQCARRNLGYCPTTYLHSQAAVQQGAVQGSEGGAAVQQGAGDRVSGQEQGARLGQAGRTGWRGMCMPT